MMRRIESTIAIGVAALAIASCGMFDDHAANAVGAEPEHEPTPTGAAVAQVSSTFAAVDPDLSLVRIPPGSSMRTLRRLQLWSEVMPWIDNAGSETWVLSVDPSLRARLEQDGLEVVPFSLPPEYERWSQERQQAMNLVAKGCMLEDGSVFDAGTRWQAKIAGAEVWGPNYASYYMPYDESAGSDVKIPSFPDRVRAWRDHAVDVGYGPQGGRVTVSGEMIGGWPADGGSALYDDHGLVTDGIRRPISYIDIGWPQQGLWRERRHEGPRAIVLVTANQHPRELVTHEAAWRLAQRIVAYYALADVDYPNAPQSEGNRPRGFWQDLIDRGLHIVIVPTVNPSTYNDVVVKQWPSAPTKSGQWWRSNGNHVDINRNFPAHWLQAGWDAGEKWGSGSTPDDAGFAGAAPASEPETRAVLDITQNAIRNLLYGDLDFSALLRRLPVVAVDLHSAYGMVTSFTHYSNATETGTWPTEESWLCGAMSDCLHADAPGMLAIFGNNERPGMVGTTGLALSPYGPSEDDPPTPYMHGTATYNFYATSGDLVATWSDSRWAVDDLVEPRPIMSGTVEVTAYQSDNAFGFGTCAPPDRATEAIDAVVADLLPLVNRMGESAFHPADVPRGATPLRVAERFVPFPETAAVVNMGIRAEAVAQLKSWRTANDFCDPPANDDQDCHEFSSCDPSSQTCTGPWWSSYLLSTQGLREPLVRYWGFSVRHSDPDSLISYERNSTDVRLRLVDCEPADACADVPFELIRRGGHFDLYGLRLPLSAPPPRRLRLLRQVNQIGVGWTNDLEWEYVAAEIPHDVDWNDTLCASKAHGVELRSLLNGGEKIKHIKVSAPLRNGDRQQLQIGAQWPRLGADPLCEPLELRGPTSGWETSWTDYDFSSAKSYVWHTHDFDLWHAADDANPSNAWTDGVGIWLVRNHHQLDGTSFLPPTVTADLSSNGSYANCALTEIGIDSTSLQHARDIRDVMMKQGPWARRFVTAYGRFSEELVALAEAHPSFATSLETTVRKALSISRNGRITLGDRVALINAAAPALLTIRMHGSPELRQAADLALARLPELMEERGRFRSFAAPTLQDNAVTHRGRPE